MYPPDVIKISFLVCSNQTIDTVCAIHTICAVRDTISALWLLFDDRFLQRIILLLRRSLGARETLSDSQNAVDDDGVDALLDLALFEVR